MLDLSLSPISSTDLTSEDISNLISSSLGLIDTLPSSSNPPASSSSELQLSWSLHKHVGDTKIYKTTHLNEPWMGRVTTTSLPYDTVRRGLLSEKHPTEKATVMKPSDQVEIEKEWELDGRYRIQDVRKLLHVQAFSPREFLETVIFHDFSPRDFIVVSKPKEGPLRVDTDVRGAYTCVEYVRELDEGAEGVEIFFAVTSDAGGSIPRWVQNLALPGQILSDGMAFIRYFEEEREREMVEKEKEEGEEEEEE